MKKTILALLVFLVFVSLSCQRDSGVESAGNNSQTKTNLKDKISTNNNNESINYVPCDEPDAMYYEIILEIWTHPTQGSPQILLEQVSYQGREYSMNNYYVSDNIILEGEPQDQYDVKVYFKWFNCLPYCPTDYWSSAAGRVAYFQISCLSSPVNGGCIFGTCLSKPSGSATGGPGLVSGEDSFTYSPLVNNVHQLIAGKTYKVSLAWKGEDPLQNK